METILKLLTSLIGRLSIKYRIIYILYMYEIYQNVDPFLTIYLHFCSHPCSSPLKIALERNVQLCHFREIYQCFGENFKAKVAKSRIFAKNNFIRNCHENIFVANTTWSWGCSRISLKNLIPRGAFKRL